MPHRGTIDYRFALSIVVKRLMPGVSWAYIPAFFPSLGELTSKAGLAETMLPKWSNIPDGVHVRIRQMVSDVGGSL
jgi:hypothetical protein